jgi:trimeric autotransporter adhesin
MKTNQLSKVILLFLFIILQAKTFAQMGINSTGTPPANNAMLDIKSTTKGLLIPRMSTQERSLLTPSQGLTVYDTTTNGFWYYNGSSWVNLATISSASPWLTSGNNINNSNTGFVGIGTSTPLHKLSVVTPTNVYGLTHSDGNITMGSWLTPTTAQFGTKSNHPLEFFTNNGSAQMTILPNGNIGIGTVSPTAKLEIVDAGIGIATLRVKNTANFSTIDIDAATGDAALRLFHNGVLKWGVRNSNLDDFQIFNDAGNPRFMIQNGTGKIGFNTGTPQSNLHIDPIGAGSILIGTDRNVGGYTSLEMGISAQSGGSSFIQSIKSAGAANGYGNLRLNPSGGDVTFTGNVGIGTTAPSSPLDIVVPLSANALRIIVPGHIWALSNDGEMNFKYNGQNKASILNSDGSYYTYSDKRLKKNIEEIKPVLDKVLQLKAKKYQFIDSDDSTKKSTGFISQEVMELFPELVSDFKKNATDSTLYHGLNYAGFSVIAIKAIQEQQKIIEELRTRLEAIENKIKK